MNKPQLVNLLIGKSIAETILVGAIAVGAYLNAFPPTFHGWGEAVAETRSIAGWAVNNAAPSEPVVVQLFVDGKLKAAQIANLSRPDVVAAGWAGDELHGYNFALPSQPPGDHEARVYALHQSGGEAARYTLQLVGDPIRFVVNADGSWRRVN
jgi:hypothetical protein